MKSVIITGITGQDGANLTELLLEKNDFEIHGIIRRSSNFNTQRIDKFLPNINLHYGDMSDYLSISQLIRTIKPNYIFHLAAQSHVKVSFDIPEYTFNINATGTLRLLEAIRNESPKTRMYTACSSEMYGDVLESPQTESTPFNPISPYGCSKVAAFWLSKTYRKAYGMFVANGILFNHEGKNRHETFVTRKITLAACRIKLGLQEHLCLGNLDAKRDWGSSEDYVRGMLMMLEHHEPDDFILATGETHTVREFCEKAFKCLNLDYKKYVKTDKKYYRPAEVNTLQGDYSKAKRILSWEPTIKFDQLIENMITNDYAIVEREVLMRQA